MGKILVVDDDRICVDMLKYNLSNEGFFVIECSSASHVTIDMILECRMVLADAMRQDFNGIDLINKIKSHPLTEQIPVMILSQTYENSSIVRALNAGADDFISKPLGLHEVMARVRAVLRRHPLIQHVEKKSTGKIIIKHLGIQIDTQRHTVVYNDRTVPLTRTEYSILEFLISNLNRYYTRDEIYTEVWNEPDDGFNVRIVDTNISRLRKKLGECGKCIINRYGLGYGFFDRIIG